MAFFTTWQNRVCMGRESDLLPMGWHYMTSCHGPGARHGTFCTTSTLAVIPLQLMAITGQGLVCQGLKSKLIWLHSHSEPQTEICRSNESVKRPPEAWSGHMQRQHSLSIRLLSILWQIDLEPKQRKAFDIPSTQQYTWCIISCRFHHSLSQSLYPDWMNEWCCGDFGGRHGSAGHWLASHSYCSDATGGKAGVRLRPDSPRTLAHLETDGFFRKVTRHLFPFEDPASETCN